eukprot:TRINITY_DN65621_c10_g6_i2.p2 TRINITY_DN65621_c10_g6~~TRINITY_DN65621_c10_g6_i2.p2  ORF type:complete len:262 (-),score=121.11 TRINITY_DN65621_c10_g6_i2:90-875(-)
MAQAVCGACKRTSQLRTMIRHYLEPPELDKPTTPKFNDFEWFSQVGQDKFIDRLYNHTHNRFAIEVGAYDGEQWSNTLSLEMNRGYRCLLIEANPFTYQQMRDIHRHAWEVQACLSMHSEVDKVRFIVAGAISSAEGLTDDHQRSMQEKGGHTYSGKDPLWDGYGQTVNATCFPLYDMLVAINERVVDFFSLDIEGAEYGVLESLPWNKVHIKAMFIEQHETEKVKKLLAQHSYSLNSVAHSDIIMILNKSEADNGIKWST